MRNMLLFLSGALAIAVAPVLHADDKLFVQVPALLDSNAPIAEAVKRDCRVEALVGDQVFLRVKERFPGAEQISDSGKSRPDRTLKVTIVGVLGAGGGAWSGSKAITIRAEVVQNAKTIANTTLTRQSGGGAFGGLKGTCSIMERIAVTLGKDVAAWVPAAMAMAPAPAPAAASGAAPPAAAAQSPKEEGK